MLARSSFDQAYIDAVRKRVKAQIASFEALAESVADEGTAVSREDFAALASSVFAELEERFVA